MLSPPGPGSLEDSPEDFLILEISTPSPSQHRARKRPGPPLSLGNLFFFSSADIDQRGSLLRIVLQDAGRPVRPSILFLPLRLTGQSFMSKFFALQIALRGPSPFPFPRGLRLQTGIIGRSDILFFLSVLDRIQAPHSKRSLPKPLPDGFLLSDGSSRDTSLTSAIALVRPARSVLTQYTLYLSTRALGDGR